MRKYQDSEQVDVYAMSDIKDLPFSWWEKCLLRIAPKLFMKRQLAQYNIAGSAIDYAHTLFGDRKIHIFPLSGYTGRGFVISMDNALTLWFIQDGDRFVYDGYEIGEYVDGDVTVFDTL